MDPKLEQAIYKAKSYDGTLDQEEYDLLLRWAKLTGSEGRQACDALAEAKKSDYRQFREVWSRDKKEEERLAALGTPSSSGCFLTSACMQAKQEQFDDNCWELRTLRHLRDTYGKTHYPDEVQRYYLIAPQIVEAVDRSPRKAESYAKIYSSLVLPAASAAASGQDKQAYEIYKRGCLLLEELFLKTPQTDCCPPAQTSGTRILWDTTEPSH